MDIAWCSFRQPDLAAWAFWLLPFAGAGGLFFVPDQATKTFFLGNPKLVGEVSIISVSIQAIPPALRFVVIGPLPLGSRQPQAEAKRKVEEKKPVTRSLRVAFDVSSSMLTNDLKLQPGDGGQKWFFRNS